MSKKIENFLMGLYAGIFIALFIGFLFIVGHAVLVLLSKLGEHISNYNYHLFFS